MEHPPVIPPDSPRRGSAPARRVPVAAIGHLEWLLVVARQHPAEKPTPLAPGPRIEVATTVGSRD